MGKIVCERVQWELGSFTGIDGLGEETVGRSVDAAVGDGSALGGGPTSKVSATSKGGTTSKSGSIPNSSVYRPAYCFFPQTINSSK